MKAGDAPENVQSYEGSETPSALKSSAAVENVAGASSS